MDFFKKNEESGLYSFGVPETKVVVPLLRVANTRQLLLVERWIDRLHPKEQGEGARV